MIFSEDIERNQWYEMVQETDTKISSKVLAELNVFLIIKMVQGIQ